MSTGLRRIAMIGLLLLAPAVAIPAAANANSGTRIVERSVSFDVANVNRSKIPCTSDGKRYRVRGHITGPARAHARPGTATLLLHGLSYGEFFSNSRQPGYNFARKQAAAGHVTVTVDRLGYDSSDKPGGKDICFGSRADIAHQIVQQLRRGSYASASARPAFSRVVLAGHSVGAIIAQAAAYSFGDIDALMVLSYSDTVVSAAAKRALQSAIAACKAGGSRSDGDRGPAGYVYFGADTPQQFIQAHFYTPVADPTVVRTTAALRNRDPCGDVLSYDAAVKTNLAKIKDIKVPTLVLTGNKDRIYPTPASTQAALLTGSQNVSSVTLANTGHALTLHRTDDEFQGQVSLWLRTHSLGR